MKERKVHLGTQYFCKETQMFWERTQSYSWNAILLWVNANVLRKNTELLRGMQYSCKLTQMFYKRTQSCSGKHNRFLNKDIWGNAIILQINANVLGKHAKFLWELSTFANVHKHWNIIFPPTLYHFHQKENSKFFRENYIISLSLSLCLFLTELVVMHSVIFLSWYMHCFLMFYRYSQFTHR